MEAAFRRHAALLQAAHATPGQGSIALDGKTLRGSFDKFNDRAAAQVLNAFATDTALVLAHIDIAEKSNEIPAAQALLAELGLAPGAVVTLDAMHCQKTSVCGPPACGGRNSRRYSRAEGSGRELFGGLDPVKKRGPWAVADLRMVTPSGDPG